MTEATASPRRKPSKKRKLDAGTALISFLGLLILASGSYVFHTSDLEWDAAQERLLHRVQYDPIQMARFKEFTKMIEGVGNRVHTRLQLMQHLAESPTALQQVLRMQEECASDAALVSAFPPLQFAAADNAKAHWLNFLQAESEVWAALQAYLSAKTGIARQQAFERAQASMAKMLPLSAMAKTSAEEMGAEVRAWGESIDSATAERDSEYDHIMLRTVGAFAVLVASLSMFVFMLTQRMFGDQDPNSISTTRRLLLLYVPRNSRAWMAHVLFYLGGAWLLVLLIFFSYNEEADSFSWVQFSRSISAPENWVTWLFYFVVVLLVRHWAAVERVWASPAESKSRYFAGLWWYPALNSRCLLAHCFLMFSVAEALFLFIPTTVIVGPGLPVFERIVGTTVVLVSPCIAYLWVAAEFRVRQKKHSALPRRVIRVLSIGLIVLAVWIVTLMTNVRLIPRIALLRLPPTMGGGSLGVPVTVLILIRMLLLDGVLPFYALYRTLREQLPGQQPIWTAFRT